MSIRGAASGQQPIRVDGARPSAVQELFQALKSSAGEKEAEILVDGGTGGIAGYRSRLSFCVPYISDTPAPDIVFYGVGNSSRIAKFMPERTHGLWRKDPQSKLESTAGHGLDLSVPRP